jgi:hypothetical protein
MRGFFYLPFKAASRRDFQRFSKRVKTILDGIIRANSSINSLRRAVKFALAFGFLKGDYLICLEIYILRLAAIKGTPPRRARI